MIPWGRREGIVLGPEGKDQKAIYYITTRAAVIEPLVQKVKKALGDLVKDVRASSRLLLEQALLVEGGELKDPAGFVKRMIATTIARTCSPREERDGGSKGWGPGEG